MLHYVHTGHSLFMRRNKEVKMITGPGAVPRLYKIKLGCSRPQANLTYAQTLGWHHKITFLGGPSFRYVHDGPSLCTPIHDASKTRDAPHGATGK
jgi:hypothetical protein